MADVKHPQTSGAMLTLFAVCTDCRFFELDADRLHELTELLLSLSLQALDPVLWPPSTRVPKTVHRQMAQLWQWTQTTAGLKAVQIQVNYERRLLRLHVIQSLCWFPDRCMKLHGATNM